MKKIFTVLLAAVLTLSVSACDGEKAPSQNMSVQEDNTTLPENGEFSQDAAATIHEPTDDSVQKPIQTGDCIYRNEELGYQITLPDSWDGWYAVIEHDSGVTEFVFLGKSDTAATETESLEIPGLPMFMIVDEAIVLDEGYFLDSVQEVGEAMGIKYYYATDTDSSLSVLFDAVNNAESLEKSEQLLLEADFDKMQQMTTEGCEAAGTFLAID